MAGYMVGFEQVELVNGLGEDKPVWLYLRGTLYNGNDLETPLWIDEVGSLPPDPNRNIFPSFPRGEAGRYAAGLVRDKPVSNHSSMGQPNFQLDSVEVGPGQVLEVMVIMLPKVWLERKKVPVSKLDALAAGFFGLSLQNFIEGYLGAGIGGLFTALVLGGGEQEVEVPCLNSVIMARHLFTAADLAQMSSAGSLRFGPRDNDASAACEAIDSYYWLSANNRGYSFGPMPEFEQGDCRLEPRVHLAAKNQLQGAWADVGDHISDRAWVNLVFTNERSVNVTIVEKLNGRSDTLTFENVTVTLGFPPGIFLRNFVDDPTFVPRWPAPTCRFCRRLHKPLAFIEIEKELLWAGMFSGSHFGARPLFPFKFDTDRVNLPPPPETGDPCVDSKPAREYRLERRQRDALEAPVRLNETLYVKNAGEGLVHLWPAGTVPMRHLETPRFAIEDFDFDIIPALMQDKVISWMVECSPQIYLASYGEVQPNGEVCATRLRYVHKTESGQILFDLMLRPPKPFVH